MKRISAFFFLVITACMLVNSKLSLFYAAMGLQLWFEKMVPTLLPFMILSGIVIRLHLTETMVAFVYPFVAPIYHVSRKVCYCMLLGFLCGFPMGARVTADLYSRGEISREEGQYLLAFCNNIGPIYTCSFVLPLLQRKHPLPYLAGMYGIPLLYGLLLRYTLFRGIKQSSGFSDSSFHKNRKKQKKELKLCKKENHLKRYSVLIERLFLETDNAIFSSVQSILSLGGYMILFNLMNLLPHVLLGHPLPLLAPLLEITGGLNLLKAKLPLFSMLALSFGGLSCLAQTYSCIKNTDLSITEYILHKIILTLCNGLFYLLWFVLSPSSFLA